MTFPMRFGRPPGTVEAMKTAAPLTAPTRLATLILAAALALAVATGVALGAGHDEGHAAFRTQVSAPIEVLPGTTAAALAECEPGERAVSGSFLIGGDHDGVEVRASRRVVVAPHLSGWLVTARNETSGDQLVTARAVCETDS